MSTTRRQSGRLLAKEVAALALAADEDKATNTTESVAAHPRPSSLAVQDDETDPEPMDSDEEPNEENSDSESDGGSEYGAKRATKRQRTKSSSNSKSEDKTCYLASMPPNILSEIFSNLGPKDLIFVARTSRANRHHLLSKEVSGVWKKSREIAEAPDCPDDISEQRWAHLLYGEARCKSCGARGIQRVDFGIRRRACKICLGANLVVTSKVKYHFPDLDETILDLIPYTNTAPSSQGRPSHNKYYWKSDIEKMEQALARHQRAIKMQTVDARKKFDEFKAKRVAVVAAIPVHSKLCEEWIEDSAHRRNSESASKKEERFEAIKEKFIALGYMAEDLYSIKNQSLARQPTALTDRIWGNVKPRLEPIVAAAKDRRLAQERQVRINGRVLLVKNIFNKYKKTLVPNQWRYLPGLFELVQFPAFKAVVEAPNDVDVRAAHFNDAVAALPDLLVAWIAARKAQLAQLMHNTLALNPIPASTPSSETAYLNLATAVFQCRQDNCRGHGPNSPHRSPCVIGWNAAVAHHCGQQRLNWLGLPTADLCESVLQSSKEGVAAAVSVIAAAGLQPERATCVEMDTLDLRFLCNVCQPRQTNNRRTYDAYPWRSAVSHFASNHAANPSWRLLTPAEAQQVKAREPQDPTLSWSCNHCPQYLDDYKKYAEVAQHVKTVHAILNPTVSADLFRYIDMPLKPAPFLLPLPRVENRQPAAAIGPKYRCLQCSSLGKGKQRDFIMNGVLSHLKDKHKILDPVQGQDWGAFVS